jgi:hypothetical protein
VRQAGGQALESGGVRALVAWVVTAALHDVLLIALLLRTALLGLLTTWRAARNLATADLVA